MADLSDIQAALTVKVVGSGLTGTETTPIKSSVNGDLGVVDTMTTGGVHGTVSVSTTAIAIRVGGSNLTERKNMMFYNDGNNTIYWGYSNTVTTTNGMPLMKGQSCSGDWGAGVTIFAIAASGTHTVRVNEGA